MCRRTSSASANDSQNGSNFIRHLCNSCTLTTSETAMYKNMSSMKICIHNPKMAAGTVVILHVYGIRERSIKICQMRTIRNMCMHISYFILYEKTTYTLTYWSWERAHAYLIVHIYDIKDRRKGSRSRRSRRGGGRKAEGGEGKEELMDGLFSNWSGLRTRRRVRRGRRQNGEEEGKTCPLCHRTSFG